MRKLGEYILGNRFQAIAITSMFSVLGLLMPLLSFICAGVPPGLVTLRKGALAGMQVITGSLLLTMAFALLANINPYIVFAYAMGIWIPVWFCACILRHTESQGSLILAAGTFALLYILLSHYLLGNVTEWWKTWLEVWIKQAMEGVSNAQLRDMQESAAPLMNAMTAAGFFLSLTTTLLLARWWQAALFNPGGFRKEFHTLKLPRLLIVGVLAGLVLVVMDMAAPGSLALDILILLIFIYLFQGLASMHRLVAAKKMARGWLIGIYIFILIVPQVILFLACLGMADSWLIRVKTDRTNDNL